MSQICLLYFFICFEQEAGFNSKNYPKNQTLALAAPLIIDIFYGQRRRTQCDGTHYPPNHPTRATAL